MFLGSVIILGIVEHWLLMLPPVALGNRTQMNADERGYKSFVRVRLWSSAFK